MKSVKIPLCFFITTFIFYLCLPGAYLHATTWYVDGGVDSSSRYGLAWADAFKNLQDAIDAAEADDVILVKEGRYPLSASIAVDKAVHIYGGFPADVTYPDWEDRDVALYETVLDGQYAVYNLLYITDNATIDGFTIRNADDGCTLDEEGGAGYIAYASPTFNNCRFIENSVGGDGGALYVRYGDLVIINCIFENNFSGTSGGALYASYSNTVIDNCTFTENYAGYRGGGIYNNESSSTLTSCSFLGNIADLGGGISNFKSSPNINDCIFSGNNALTQGGGIYNNFHAPTVTHCSFLGNTANVGGGIDNVASAPNITNCIFLGNSAKNGGGIRNHTSDSTITNCTISDNSAMRGSEIYFHLSSDSIINCIVWSNAAAGTLTSIGASGSSFSITYSDVVAEGYAGSNGNIRTDPLFVRNPDAGPDGEWGTDDDDYGDLHLRSTSPCIDAGRSTGITLSDMDIDGDPRIIDGDTSGSAEVDMGADEYSGGGAFSEQAIGVSGGDGFPGATTGSSGDGPTLQAIRDGGNGLSGLSPFGGTHDEEISRLEKDGVELSDIRADKALVSKYVCNGLWPSLKNPWYFTHPADVAVDPWGNLYVADTGKHRIQKFTSGGKFIASWGSPGSGNGQFAYPTGIATDLYGNVFVVDTDNHRIQKFDSNGAFMLEICEQITGDDSLSYPQGVTIDQGGNIYVADTFNDRIVKFNNDGQLLALWGTYGSGEGEFDLPRGIASDRNGHIYVADRYNHRIQKFNDNGTFLTAWGSEGSAAGELDSPLGIAAGEAGVIYVSDSENHRIVKLRDDGSAIAFVAVKGTCGTDDDQLCSPAGIAANVQGTVYLTDVWNNRIQKFHDGGADLTHVSAMSNRGEQSGEFIAPESIAVDKRGYIYVADTDNHRIQKFSADGEFISEWSGNAARSPQGIAVGSGNRIYVAGTGNNQVSVYTRFGEYGLSRHSYSKNTTFHNFYKPSGIACDDNGHVYVVDSGNHYIIKFTSNYDAQVAEWGEVGTGDGAFENPHGIAVDHDGYVYVADTGNHRIQKFQPDGTYVSQWGTYGDGQGEFNAPRGIAAAVEFGHVYVYVADSGNHRIQKFTAAGQFVEAFGGKGLNPGQMNDPGDLCIGKDGRIYVADTGNDRIQVFSPLQMPNSKAIIVAGRTHAGDALWGATSMNAKFAYRTLLYQGFSKDRICYLSPDIHWDQDNNGEFDDVDGAATRKNLHEALTVWAQDADSLVLCLIDHGGPQTLRLNESEVLKAGELAEWLDSFDGPVTVVYDACSSGSFLQALKKENRTVITSADSNQRAKFLAQGTISFSNYFWSAVFSGESVSRAFEKAGSAIINIFEDQVPRSEPERISKSLKIGYGTSISGHAPEIGTVFPQEQSISNGTSATIRVSDIIDPDSRHFSGVWAVVVPPGFSEDQADNPMVEMPSFELSSVAGESTVTESLCYEGTFDQFTMAGTYDIAVYAMDEQGNTSTAGMARVIVENPLAQKAIVVVGGGRADVYAKKGVQRAYGALKAQGYTDENIVFLGPEGIHCYGNHNCVDGAATLAALENTINAAHNTTHDLVLYMIGPGGAGTFRINNHEILHAAVLDGWLDQLQAYMDGMLTVIYDADRSGSFIPLLAAPEGKKRIVFTSTTADETAYYGQRGIISSSTFFWSQVRNGEDVYDAYKHSGKAARCLSRRYRTQTPSLDDNGNGIANEYADGFLAANYKIGIGLNFADDSPMISALFAESPEAGEISVWASVTGTGIVKRVWAVITPVEYLPGENDELVEVDLDYDNETALAVGLFEPDDVTDYKITVYARDDDNNTSLPLETKVYLHEYQARCSDATADAFEDDNTKDDARGIVVNAREAQKHTFCTATDEDWVMFYGREGEYYSIAADDLGENSRPVIELYNENLDMRRSKIPDEDGMVYLDWLCPEDGIYYVRLWNDLLFDGDAATTRYSLRVYNPYWPDFLVLVSGTVRDEMSSQLIDGAVIMTDGGGAAVAMQGRYDLYLYPGDWNLYAAAAGYHLYYDRLNIGTRSRILNADIGMYPDWVSTTSTTSIKKTTSSTTTTSIKETTSSSTTTTSVKETTSSTTTSIKKSTTSTTTTKSNISTTSVPIDPTSTVTTTVIIETTITTTSIDVETTTTTSDSSSTTTINFSDPPVIISVPDNQATVGRHYVYTVEVKSNDSEPEAGAGKNTAGMGMFSYRLTQKPETMTIDVLKGYISWTPQLKDLGSHEIEVAVQDGNGQEARQQFAVMVKPGSVCPLQSAAGTNKQKIDTLRSFRDKRLIKTETGRLLVYLYYVHSAEVAGILGAHPELMAEVRTLMFELYAVLKAGLTCGDTIKITKMQEKRMVHVLKKLRTKASPGLKKGLALVLRRLEDRGFMEEIGVERETVNRVR